MTMGVVTSAEPCLTWCLYSKSLREAHKLIHFHLKVTLVSLSILIPGLPPGGTSEVVSWWSPLAKHTASGPQ